MDEGNFDAVPSFLACLMQQLSMALGACRSGLASYASRCFSPNPKIFQSKVNSRQLIVLASLMPDHLGSTFIGVSFPPCPQICARTTLDWKLATIDWDWRVISD
jgi:hypothetical protein